MMDIESQETQRKVEKIAGALVWEGNALFDDVVQEMYLSLLQSDAYKDGTPFSYNDFRDAKHDAIDALRSRRYANSYGRAIEHLHLGHARELDSWAEPDLCYEERFINQLTFQEMLGLLSGNEKLVFGYLVAGMKEREIGAILSLGRSMVAKYKWRAIRRIQKRM